MYGNWILEPPEGHLHGTVYTDGSAIDADVKIASRACWGLSMIPDGSDVICAAACGPLPTFIQTSGCAELYAAAVALRMAAPPVTIVTEYEQLIHGWQLGPGSYTHPGSKSGEVWKLFWHTALDFGTEQITLRRVPVHKRFSAVFDGLFTYRDWSEIVKLTRWPNGA